EARQLRLAAPARRPEIRPGAGQKDEARRAEVGDPAGEEEKRRGAGEIGRLEQPGIEMKKLADMIEGHDHHDQPADEVDRVESGPGRPAAAAAAVTDRCCASVAVAMVPPRLSRSSGPPWCGREEPGRGGGLPCPSSPS